MSDLEHVEVSIEEQENSVAGETGLDSRQFVPFDENKAIELLAEHPNNVNLVCKMMGNHPATFYWHMKNRQDFAIRVQEIRDACCDALETTMFNLGVKETSFNFNDRIAYLRAHRPHLYNPAKKVIVEGYSMNTKEKVNRLAGLEGAIDAEVVKAYSTHKELKQMRLEKKAGETLSDKAREERGERK